MGNISSPNFEYLVEATAPLEGVASGEIVLVSVVCHYTHSFDLPGHETPSGERSFGDGGRANRTNRMKLPGEGSHLGEEV